MSTIQVNNIQRVDGTESFAVDSDGSVTFAAGIDVSSGSVKLDGNYPVGNQNVALGNTALDANTTGENNTAIGHAALTANTDGLGNTSVGSKSLENNISGDYNTATGQLALRNTTANNNTAVGYAALTANTTASNNTAVGYQAANSNTTGTQNVAIGRCANFANTTGIGNTVVGTSALEDYIGNYNTAIGYTAAANSITGASSLVAIGAFALNGNTTGLDNTAVGRNSICANSTGGRNTAVGAFALDENTTASDNTVVGYAALTSNTTGHSNTAIGANSLLSNVSNNRNTAVGFCALANSTSNNNTAVGQCALATQTSGADNAAFGDRALAANTTGCYNTSVGMLALCSNTTAANNTAIGNRAGNSSTGERNTFVGSFSANNNTTGTQNTFVGRGSGYDVTSGSCNTLIGENAGNTITTGSKNTIIGKYSGNQCGLDIRTASNYIVLSDGAGNPRVVVSCNGSVGLNGRIPNTGGIGLSGVGAEFNNGDGVFYFGRSGGTPFFLQRCTNTGEMIAFMNGGNTRGSIGLSPTGSDHFKVYGCSNYGSFGSCTVGFQAYGGFNHAVPYAPGTCAYRDNALCWGGSSVRWKTIYAVNSTINTSDINEKQDIESLTDAELRVAAQAKTLVKKFRWKQSVAEKGEDVARIHVGVIAQELQSAFEAEGLDPHRYSLFTKDVWWEAEVEFEQPIRDENNIETSEMETVSRIEHFREEENAPAGAIRKERLGVRYTELLAFIIAAI